MNKPLNNVLISDKKDVKIIIGNKTILANKLLLTQKSEYFANILRKRKDYIEINEKGTQYLDQVLQLSDYDFNNNNNNNNIDWHSMTPKNFFDLIQTAHKFKFNETEISICRKFAQTFPPIDTLLTSGRKPKNRSHECANSLETIWEIYEMSKSHELSYLSELCLQHIDQNASQVFKYFDWFLYLSSDVLIDVFKRDSFGLSEIQIFYMIKKWYGFWFNDKNELNPLLDTIRLELIDKKDLKSTVSLSGLLKKSIIDKTLDALNFMDSNMIINKSRISCEPNRKFPINDYSFDKISVILNTFSIPKTDAILVNVFLNIRTRINHIEFTISSTNYDLVYYYLQVFDLKYNEWHKVIDNSHTPCIGSQTIYFRDYLTNKFRIIVTNLDTNQVLINSISYEFSDNYSDLNLIIGCHYNQNIFPKLFTTNWILFDCKEYFYYSIKDYNNIDKYVIDNDVYIESKTIYLIRLSQPIVMESIVLGVSLQSKFHNFDDKYEAKVKVEVCSSFGRQFISSKWKKVSLMQINETGFYKFLFNKQIVILIRISGFRYSSVNNKKLPLSINSVEVPNIG